jgi:prepilin-type N-terminal cleavage/methylation domain-containing protein
MMQARAFTLTEMLVVLAIMGLAAGLALTSGPAFIAKARLDAAAALLGDDLARASMRARADGAFGQLAIAPRQNAYAIGVGAATVASRTLAPGLTLAGPPLRLDPAGRWQAGALQLENGDAEIVFVIDPFTGVAHRASFGAARGSHRHGRTRPFADSLPDPAERRPQRPFARARWREGRKSRNLADAGGAPPLARPRARRGKQRSCLDTPVQSRHGSPAGTAAPGALHAHHRYGVEPASGVRDKLDGAAPGLLSAMTLLEVLVALAIFALCAAVAFDNLGQGLNQSRSARDEARFWADVSPAALALSELSAAAVAPSERHTSADEARFRIYLPRLSPSPTEVDLHINSDAGGSTLMLRSPALAAPSTLLASTSPLRFADDNQALILEVRQRGRWLRIAEAAFLADAPMTCVFDPIARVCR